MSKRNVLSLGLALFLWVGLLPLPAAAADAGTGMTPQAVEKLIQILGAHGYTEEDIQGELWHDFTDGPQSFYDKETHDILWVNAQGDEVFQELVKDYTYVIHPFQNGYASVEQSGKGGLQTGYINAAGEIVIPCQYGRYYDAGDTWAGHVQDGRVWVLREDYWLDFGTWKSPETWEVAQLDLEGNVVVPWKTVDAFAEGLHMLNDGGFCDDCEVMKGAAEPAAESRPDTAMDPLSTWAQEEVEAAVMAGLVPELTGNPGYQDAITREQFAELAFTATTQMAGEISMTEPVFFDTDNIKVRRAAGLGIVNGVGDGLFDPKATTNREQIATMLQRAWGVVGTPAPAAGLGAYSDAWTVSGWAAEAMGSMVASGIVKGTSDVTLSPQDTCTVEQAIVLVYRLYQQVK